MSPTLRSQTERFLPCVCHYQTGAVLCKPARPVCTKTSSFCILAPLPSICGKHVRYLWQGHRWGRQIRAVQVIHPWFPSENWVLSEQSEAHTEITYLSSLGFGTDSFSPSTPPLAAANIVELLICASAIHRTSFTTDTSSYGYVDNSNPFIQIFQIK